MNQKINCPICNTSINSHNFLESYISPYNKQEYKLYECSNCLLQWWELLKIIPEFYEKEIFNSYELFHKGMLKKISRWHEPFFQYFPKELKLKLLDVECGDGRFIKYCREIGFEVWGIDFDKKSIEAIKRNFHIETVFPMSLEEFYEYAKNKNLKFDVITFFEVLEHQDNPRNFLEMVKDILNEKGWIAGSVPNREKLFAEIDWKYFHGDYPPHHFLRFSKNSLKNILKIIDFSTIEVIPLNLSLWDASSYIEKKIFGNLDSMKIKLKSVITKNKNTAKYTIEELKDVTEITPVTMLLMILKFIRNFTLLPFTLMYIGQLKRNGQSLYFQAQK